MTMVGPAMAAAERRRRRPVDGAVVRRLAEALLVTTVAAGLLVWVQLLRPQSLGGPVAYVVVHGSSMAPHYAENDLVVVRRQATYHVGEVVAYRVPRGQVGQGLVVVHRIVAVTAQGWVVRGDNNPAVDPWQPTTDDVVGAAWWHAPRLGALLVVLHRPLVLAGGAALLALLLVVGGAAEPATTPSPTPTPSRGVAAFDQG